VLSTRGAGPVADRTLTTLTTATNETTGASRIKSSSRLDSLSPTSALMLSPPRSPHGKKNPLKMLNTARITADNLPRSSKAMPTPDMAETSDAIQFCSSQRARRPPFCSNCDYAGPAGGGASGWSGCVVGKASHGDSSPWLPDGRHGDGSRLTSVLDGSETAGAPPGHPR
jgi:hypothetical protein